MPSIGRSLTINAAPERVYEALVDHSRWLDWNPHVREMRLLGEGPLAPGSKARVAHKLNPFASTWEVTEVTPGRSFAWASSSFFPGLRLVFDHIAEGADGGTRATIRIDVEGPLSFLAGLAGAVYGRNFLDRSLGALKDLVEGEAPDKSGPEPEQPPAEEPEPEAEPEAKPEVKNE